MYKYKIGYNSYEESNYTELEHEEYFTEDELTGMVSDCIIELIPILHKNDNFLHNFRDVFEGDFNDKNVIDLLIKNKGFKLIEYSTNLVVFGWSGLFDDKDWESENDEIVKKLQKNIKKAGFTKEEYDSRYDDMEDK